MTHQLRSAVVALAVVAGMGGCKRECPEEVPANAVVAGTTERLEEDGSLYICPKSGADVAARNVVVYGDEESRIRVYGEGVQVFAAAHTEVEVTAPEADVVAHSTSTVELDNSDTHLERCAVELKVPERLQAICRGDPPEPTGDTGTTFTGGGSTSTNGGNGGNNNGTTSTGGTGGYRTYEGYYITGSTADTGTGT